MLCCINLLLDLTSRVILQNVSFSSRVFLVSVLSVILSSFFVDQKTCHVSRACAPGGRSTSENIYPVDCTVHTDLSVSKKSNRFCALRMLCTVLVRCFDIDQIRCVRNMLIHIPDYGRLLAILYLLDRPQMHWPMPDSFTLVSVQISCS